MPVGMQQLESMNPLMLKRRIVETALYNSCPFSLANLETEEENPGVCMAVDDQNVSSLSPVYRSLESFKLQSPSSILSEHKQGPLKGRSMMVYWTSGEILDDCNHEHLLTVTADTMFRTTTSALHMMSWRTVLVINLPSSTITANSCLQCFGRL